MTNWESMGNRENSALRRLLTKELIAASIQIEIEAIRAAIKNIRQILLVSGMEVTDLYHDMRRETAFTRDETQIAPRVRLDDRRGTPSFYWERTVRHSYPLAQSQSANKQSKTKSYIAYVRRRGARVKEKMQVYLLSKHVPMLKKTQSVSMKEFEQEPEWVRTMATLIEPQLAELRQLAKTISEVNCALSRFERLVQSCFNKEQKSD